MEYYRINYNQKDHYVMSNLFQWDMLVKMLGKIQRVSCDYMTPFCNRFCIISGENMINVYVNRLYAEEVVNLEKEGTVKKWKRVYNV